MTGEPNLKQVLLSVGKGSQSNQEIRWELREGGRTRFGSLQPIWGDATPRLEIIDAEQTANIQVNRSSVQSLELLLKIDSLRISLAFPRIPWWQGDEYCEGIARSEPGISHLVVPHVGPVTALGQAWKRPHHLGLPESPRHETNWTSEQWSDGKLVLISETGTLTTLLGPGFDGVISLDLGRLKQSQDRTRGEISGKLSVAEAHRCILRDLRWRVRKQIEGCHSRSELHLTSGCSLQDALLLVLMRQAFPECRLRWIGPVQQERKNPWAEAPWKPFLASIGVANRSQSPPHLEEKQAIDLSELLPATPNHWVEPVLDYLDQRSRVFQIGDWSSR